MMHTDDARALLESTQQMRTLWAGAVSKDYVYAVVINVAIWTYFLKAHVESVPIEPSQGLSYLAIAAGLSSLSLGLWRLFSRHMCDRIAGFYPDLLVCEHLLGVRTDQGTAGYLGRTIPRLRRLLYGEELNPNQQAEAISFLVERKSMARRSHIVTDITVLAIIVGMFVLCLSVHSKIELSLAVGSLMVTILGFLLHVCAMFSFQRYPTQATISEAIAKYAEE